MHAPIRLLAGFLVALCLLQAPAALSQTPAPQAPDPAPTATPAAGQPQQPSAQQSRIDGWSAALDQIRIRLQRSNLAPEQLAALRGDIQVIQDGARELIASLQPEVAATQARLQALAPPAAPESGEAPAELPAVTEERNREQHRLAELNGIARQADVIVLRGDQLAQTISERRSLNFSARLFESGASLLSPSRWAETAAELPGIVASTGRIFTDWLTLIGMRATPTVIGMLAVLVVFVPLLYWGGRRVLIRLRTALETSRTPTDNLKVVAAAWIAFTNVAGPIAFLLLARFLFQSLGILPPRIADLFGSIIFATAAFTLINGLALAILAPTRPAWRLATLEDFAAAKLYGLILLGAILVAAVPVVDRLASVTAAAPIVSPTIGGALACAIAIVALLATRSFAHDQDEATEATSEQGGMNIWRWAITAAGLVALVVIVALVLGYLSLARFLVAQLVWIGIVFAVFALVSRLINLASASAFSPERRVGRWLMASLGLSRRAIGQAGILLAGLAQLLLVLFALVMIAAPWGFDSVTLTDGARTLLYGITIGTITISVTTILAALAVFVVGIVLTRIIQGWLENRFLPTTGLDPGLRASIRTGFGYLGIVTAAIIAGGYAGLDLANLAIVAGALSVGLGFGLQSIVSNFVSGLILLAERPVRPGDLINAGGETGTVRRINVRSTEIETVDRATVIIPNSALISGTVKNMVLRNRSSRIVIPVSVGYGADPAEVRDILLDCARHQAKVVHFPAPTVMFVNFGVGALDFELRLYVADISDKEMVTSDLRFAIIARLREARIERPTALPALPDTSFLPSETRSS